MIEAVIAIGLIAVCAGAIFAAVLAVAHRGASAAPLATLTFTAQNVLTDLRAATAYDAPQLAALPGRSCAFDVAEPAPNGSPEPLHVEVTVTQSAANGAAVAAVTVRDARGQSATVESALVQEAPAPGSVVPESALAPDATSADAGPTAPAADAASIPCDRLSDGCSRAHGAIAL